MRHVVAGALLLSLAACSAAPSDERSERPSDEMRDSTTDSATDVVAARSAAPGITVTAAPGVAFNYSYAFRLPAGRIAGAQEAHAQACERLGIAHCRITGMRYTLTRDDRIDAMLAFKLDPKIAREFGRRAIATIDAAQGMLVNAEITGTDAGSAIERLSGERKRISEVRARLETELARRDLTPAARTELLRQRADLDQQDRTAAASTTEQQQSLATTPMTFDYRSGTAIRGFDARSPFLQAADTALSSLQWTLAIALGALAVFGPPLLMAALLFLLWQRFGAPVWRRLRARPDGSPLP